MCILLNICSIGIYTATKYRCKCTMYIVHQTIYISILYKYSNVRSVYKNSIFLHKIYIGNVLMYLFIYRQIFLIYCICLVYLYRQIIHECLYTLHVYTVHITHKKLCIFNLLLHHIQKHLIFNIKHFRQNNF